ncbi:MAG: hypothetical protein WAX69_16720 [Victivallales bacterium]
MNTIQLQLFDTKKSTFPSLADLTNVLPQKKAPPIFCPIVNMALALALLPSKGESVNVFNNDDDDMVIVAPHTDDRYIFIVQVIGKEILGTTRGIRAEGSTLNCLLDEKFKRPDAVIVRKKEKAWDYCKFFYKSKKHSLDEYVKMISGRQVAV